MPHFFYLIFFLLFWWGCQGYYIYLYFNRRKPNQQKKINYSPLFSIIVPTLNEENIILEKIENLKKLTYSNYEVCFVDVSQDKTHEIIAKNISTMPNFALIRSQKKGRNHQINEALAYIKGDFILISDCDGLLPNNTIEIMLEEFSDENVGVVGAYVVPRSRRKDDIIFWIIQNRMRCIESIYGHSPVVVGVCHAFRKGILNRLPEDVWAEDIFIPFLANLKGFNVLYSPHIIVEETRTPETTKDFLRHKIRKAEDNIRELLRFLPDIFRMKIRWAIVYVTRFIQILVLPAFLLPFMIMLVFQKPEVLGLSMLFVGISALIELYIFGKIPGQKYRPNMLQTIKLFFLTNLILISALIWYCCDRRGNRYEKIGRI